MSKTLLIGNLTMDRNVKDKQEYVGPGGAVYFIGRILTNLKVPVTVFSPYGKDFPKELLLGIQLYPAKPSDDKTLIFENIYDSLGNRIQRIQNESCSNMLPISSLPKAVDTETVVVAPILANITSAEFRLISSRWKGRLKVLLPQGMYRKIGRNGSIEACHWNDTLEIVKNFDIVIVSEKDWNNVENDVWGWSKLGLIAVITKEDKGCSIYDKGKKG